MKILHIIEDSFANPNGIQSVLKGLIKFQNNIFEVESKLLVVTGEKITQDFGFDVFSLNSPKQIKLFIEEFSPSLVIFHSIYKLSYTYIYINLIKGKIPYIIQPHGGLTFTAQKKNYLKKKISNIIFYNKFLKNAAAISYLNKGEIKNSIEINKKFIIIENGIENIKKIKKKVSKNNSVEFIFLGRIDFFYKGLDVLIQGIKYYKENLYDNSLEVKFSLYGSGNKKEEARLSKEIVKNGISDIVEYAGPVLGVKKEEVFNRSEIMILTSRSEGMPMVILEALNYGLPCLITKETNMQEHIVKNNCGWVVELGYKEIGEGIYKATKDLINNRDTLIENSMNSLKNFEWEKIALKSINEYKKILLSNE